MRQNFALQNPPATNSIAATNGIVLTVRSVEVSPLFAGRALVYRTGPNSYELDSYAGFLVAPDHALAIPIRSYLRNSGLFQDVVEPGSPVKADESVEIHVSEFYGDFRKPGPPAAVLSLRMIFFEARNFSVSQVVWQKDYSRRVPLKSNTAADVVAAYDQALAEIMTEATSDLASTSKGN
jgi:cholesterol transport system auxiliary component